MRPLFACLFLTTIAGCRSSHIDVIFIDATSRSPIEDVVIERTRRTKTDHLFRWSHHDETEIIGRSNDHGVASQLSVSRGDILNIRKDDYTKLNLRMTSAGMYVVQRREYPTTTNIAEMLYRAGNPTYINIKRVEMVAPDTAIVELKCE